VTDVPDNVFEVLGDADALSDDFFDALAGLLLGITQRHEADEHELERIAMQVAANKATSQHASVGKAG
jgi:hypothetical protein